MQKYTKDIEIISVKSIYGLTIRQQSNLFSTRQAIASMFTPAQIPVLEFELQASHFGHGPLLDSFTMMPGDSRSN